MRKTVFLLLLLISLVVLAVRFGTAGFKNLFGVYDKSGISVLSMPEGARVFLDDKEVGKTPFEDKDLVSKEYGLKIQKDQMRWEGRVDLTAGTVAVVNRELALSVASSAGEVLTLEKGQGVTVISSPTDADVEIDGNHMGKTPLTLNIEAGEHTFNISRSNYLKRSIRAKLPQDYNLTVVADLGLSEADLPAASAPVVTPAQKILVKETPTGFLRVRDKASLNGSEIARVKPGDTLILLEELKGWVKVRLSEGTEGFVSSDYVSKKPDL